MTRDSGWSLAWKTLGSWVGLSVLSLLSFSPAASRYTTHGAWAKRSHHTQNAKAGPESVGERGDMAKQLVQDFGDRSGDEPRAMEESCDRAACRLCGNAQVGTKIGGLNRPAYELYTELARWGDTGDRSSSRLGGRKVRTPRARTLDNIQAERSDTSTTENKPPMAAVGDLGFFRRLR